MSVSQKIKGIFGVLVAVALVGALAPWLDLNEAPKRPIVTNTDSGDQRFHVQATVSWEAGANATVSWASTGGGGVDTPQRVDTAHGWSGSGRRYVRNFGPYRRGDIFQLRLYAGNGPLRCALLTVGMKQQHTAPATVYGEDGRVTCRITIGD